MVWKRNFLSSLLYALQTSHLPGRTEFITKRLGLDLCRFLFRKLYIPVKIVSAISHFVELLRDESGLVEATNGEENEGVEQQQV